MFSTEICKMFKNTYLEAHLWISTSVFSCNFIYNAWKRYSQQCVIRTLSIHRWGFSAKKANHLLFPQKRSIIDIWHVLNTEAVAQRCFGKKVFPQIFRKLTGKHSYLSLLKKRLWHRCFLVKFEKFVTPFLQKTCGGCFCQYASELKNNIWCYNTDDSTAFPSSEIQV